MQTHKIFYSFPPAWALKIYLISIIEALYEGAEYRQGLDAAFTESLYLNLCCIIYFYVRRERIKKARFLKCKERAKDETAEDFSSIKNIHFCYKIKKQKNKHRPL